MATRSTGWKEHVGADEAERHAGYPRDFDWIRAAKSANCGKGRAFLRIRHHVVPLRGVDRLRPLRGAGALMAHRPLGEVMRARKVVYCRSQIGRR